MSPTLVGGDFVISSRCFFSLSIGDLVVVDHPIYSMIVKRVEAISTNHSLLLRGDNDRSVSPLSMGWIEKKRVKGKVIFTICK